MKEKWISAYLDVAERFAQLSSAVRLKVGAVVVKDNRIISIGYNGTPAGWDNTCEDVVTSHQEGDGPTLKTKDEVIHAEANAISKLARSNDGGDGASLFCTHAPCIECAKLIYGAGIKQVFYRDLYKTDTGVKFLEKSGIDVVRVDPQPSKQLCKLTCNRILEAVAGPSLVDKWWEVPNRAFDNRLPSDVWEEDYMRIYKYLLNQVDYQC
jgi:dCMP deaminase